MRTNIEIDDQLMARALQLSGLPTKKAAVERGLELLAVHHAKRVAIDSTAGIGWEGDLDVIREGNQGDRV
jgi:Arc/MetJ family transcription regulator